MYDKKNQALTPALFADPTCEYRATPFWAWNCSLTPELLDNEIDAMREMGFGGFHMHSRVGMATKYLSEEFMDLVRHCVEKARNDNMLAWLYDEDKWPSGFAGGLNTKNPENRAKTLIVTPKPFCGDEAFSDDGEAHAHRPGAKCDLIACYDIELDQEGFLTSYTRIDKTQKAAHKKWFAYLAYSADDSWYNGQSYVDTLKKSAIEDFVQLTHERYKEAVGKDFGGIVPAIFTDEPQFSRKTALNSPFEQSQVNFPITSDFDETFFAQYGYHFYDRMPEIIWELPDHRASEARYHYHDHVAERFASAFADTVGDWCKANGIHLTGHMMEEPSLHSQTAALGDCMRSYRAFTLPGIDLLVDRRELTTAKQCQSAVHQYGREGMLSELYGVTGWGFDFRGHKLQGDWQAALGVTVRVPHLFWVSMSGEAKRDYPASIGYQSPWYREYKQIEDHFARVNTVLTRGEPEVRIGMIHPVESYWLRFGPSSHTAYLRDELESRFYELIRWMLWGNLDFDYICESLLPSQFGGAEDGFRVGEMKYDAIVVPALLTMRSTTLEALRAFRKNGGKVIFMGEIPEYVDALPSDAVREFAKECECQSWTRTALYNSLEFCRTVSVAHWNGMPANNIIYQMRREGDKKHLFLCHVDKPFNYDTAGNEDYDITVPGDWKVTEYDTMTGAIRPLRASYRNGKTTFHWASAACDSFLVTLEPGRCSEGAESRHLRCVTSWLMAERVPYTLSEPNVLLLDRPKYTYNDSKVYGPENILKADDHIRSMAGIRRRGEAMVQPWVNPPDLNPTDRVTLSYEVVSDIDYPNPLLGLESPEYTTIRWNGEVVPTTVIGTYVDPDSIKTVALPPIKKGVNTLDLELRFGDVTQLEAYYLLGQFGVEVQGSSARIVPLADSLTCGDYAHQTLPFYGGNVTYHYTVQGGFHLALQLARYRGAAVTVDVDGVRVGHLTFPPYRLDLGHLSAGEHRVDITVYGNRYNTMGPIHNTNEFDPCGPFVWRTQGNGYAYEYMLQPIGMLTSPRLLAVEE